MTAVPDKTHFDGICLAFSGLQIHQCDNPLECDARAVPLLHTKANQHIRTEEHSAGPSLCSSTVVPQKDPSLHKSSQWVFQTCCLN